MYSLGKILYEVLTGDVPYPEMDMNKVPRRYAYVVQKACERERERRYQTIQDFLNDLNAITEEEELLSRPAEEIRNEVQMILETQDFGPQNVERLVRLFNENTDDISVLTDMLPKLPDPILQSLLRDHESGMLAVLRAYDNEVSGDLPFEYCDVVANFYAKVFRWTRSDNPKLLVLRRLPLLGCSHNRWHVGTVFGALVKGLADPSLIMAVRDVLRTNPDAAQWCKPYLERQSLPSAIRSVLRNLPSSSEASEEDAPF